MQAWTKNNSITKFHARDIREAKRIHPRTLTRYLEELRMFGRIEITGGKKQRVGYEYELVTWQADASLQSTLEEWVESTLKEITQTHEKQTKGQKKKKAA